jgi:hypothetical protein
MVLDRGKKNGDGTAEIAKIQRRTENKRKKSRQSDSLGNERRREKNNECEFESDLS